MRLRQILSEGTCQDINVSSIVRVLGLEENVAVLPGFEAFSSVYARKGNGVVRGDGCLEGIVGLALPCFGLRYCSTSCLRKLIDKRKFRQARTTIPFEYPHSYIFFGFSGSHTSKELSNYPSKTVARKPVWQLRRRNCSENHVKSENETSKSNQAITMIYYSL